MQALVTFAIVVATAAVIGLPAVVAILRKHPSWIAITCLTAALGWTGIGWIAALLWARGSTDRRRQRDKVRRVEAPKVRLARRSALTAAPIHFGANDNASAPVRGATADLEADTIASDPYEDWLEQGQAISKSDYAVAAVSKDALGASDLAA